MECLGFFIWHRIYMDTPFTFLDYSQANSCSKTSKPTAVKKNWLTRQSSGLAEQPVSAMTVTVSKGVKS